MTGIHELETRLAARCREIAGTFIVGITGGVAAGKSTLARDLATRMALWLDAPSVETVGSDGFLKDNATLAAAGLTLRKGYPETYDTERLADALRRVREGAAEFTGYSHTLYDVDPSQTRTIARPDILIVEGLGLADAPLDVLIYVDADEADLEHWYIERFLWFWQAARTDPSSFYARFAHLGRDETIAFARTIWRDINLPNVREHVAPVRERADIVVRKARDHSLESLAERRLR